MLRHEWEAEGVRGNAAGQPDGQDAETKDYRGGGQGETEYILYLVNSSSNEGFLGSIEVTIWSEYLLLMSTI